MVKPNPSDRHEELLYKELQELKEQGWSVLALGNKQPDAIVISPDKERIVAIEVLGKKRRRDIKGASKGVTWDGGRSILYKRWDYGHYDDIFFVLFDRSGSDWTQRVVATETWPEMMANKWVYRTRLQYGKDPKAPIEEDDIDRATLDRLNSALEDAREGRVRVFASVEDIDKMIDEDDDEP